MPNKFNEESRYLRNEMSINRCAFKVLVKKLKRKKKIIEMCKITLVITLFYVLL